MTKLPFMLWQKMTRLIFRAIKSVRYCIGFCLSELQQHKEAKDQLIHFFQHNIFQSDEGILRSQSEWNKNVDRLQNLILTRNPVAFLEWDIIRHTMFVDGADFTKQEREYLRSSPNWNKRWRKFIVEDMFGCPPPSTHDWLSSDNLIHHAYHFATFEDTVGKKIESLRLIVEFGGGYGSMCRLAFRMGFKGKYVIFDLPAFSALQRFYLKSLKLKVTDSLAEFQKIEKGVFCVSDLHEFDQSLPTAQSDSLFLATWSLSETPLETRQQILRSVEKLESYLIAYQEKFGEMDNVIFFDAWKSQKRKNWHCFPIPYLPQNYYLFGI